MVKTLIFVVKTCSDLQIFLITKYLGHKISWSISIPFQCQNFMLNLIPFQFYAQFRSIPTAFHGQSRIHDQWQCTRISHAFLLTLIRTTLDPTSSVKYCNCSQWTLKLTPMVSSKAWLTSGAGRSRLSLTMKSWLNGTELSIKLELDRVEYEILALEWNGDWPRDQDISGLNIKKSVLTTKMRVLTIKIGVWPWNENCWQFCPLWNAIYTIICILQLDSILESWTCSHPCSY